MIHALLLLACLPRDRSDLERLGSTKPVEAKPGNGGDLVDLVNVQRGALLELNEKVASGERTRAEQAEQIERMSARLQEKVTDVRANAGAVWDPAGSTSELDARYFAGGDIGVRLAPRKVSTLVPTADGFVPGERVVPGLLTDPHPVTQRHMRVTEAYTAYALARALGAKSRDGKYNRMIARTWENLRSALTDLGGRTGDWARVVFDDPTALQRVMNSTAGTGGELLATPTLANIVRPTDIARRIVGLVPVLETPGTTFKKPVLSGRAILRRRGATANDPARYPVTSFTTSDTTLTMVKTVINVLLDSDFPNEAGLILGDAIGYIRMLIAQGVADSKEMIYLHGDTAGTHQDAIETWTMGGRYSSGDLGGSDSPLKTMLGMRAKAFDRSATVAGGGSFTEADHFGALALMGPHAADARMAMGLVTFFTHFLANALFSTVDKAGAAATLQTGQLGQVGSTPIDLSDFLPATFASTGLHTGSGTTGTVVYHNPSQHRQYVHRAGNTEWEVTEDHKGALYIGTKEEFLFDEVCLSSEVPSACIINL